MTFTVAPASKKQEMFVNSDSTITLAGGAAGCFDAETEYLSEYGWKRFDQYDGGLVGQYDLVTDTISFSIPRQYIKLPCDEFKQLSVRGVDMVLSPEHKVLFWSEGKPGILPYSEVLSRHEKSKTKGWTGKIKTTFKVSNSGISLSEGEIRLQVAAQADGRFVKEGKDNYCQMRFSKERKYLRLKDLCEKFGLKYSDRGSKFDSKYKNNTEYQVVIWPSRPTKIFDNDWWNCNQEQLKIIIDEVRHWDASDLKNESGTVRYFTKIKQNADFIQYAFHANGYNTSINIDKRGGFYTVNASMQGHGFRGIANKDGKAPVTTLKSIDGYKYCFEMPSGFLVVRRSNKIMLLGQSGKTFSSLLIALKFMQHPRATGVIFRRTSPMLKSPGSIWHEAVALYSQIYPVGLKIREQKMEIIFPNGAILKFSHMQHASDRFDHKGGQYSLVIFDEATDFDEEMVVYLLSRMRNAYVDYKPQMFLMTNPDFDSFLRLWIQDYYLDAKGIPIPERAGHQRWYFRQGNTMLWYNTKEEAEAIHGVGEKNGVGSFTFIGATCEDNPPLLKADPGYISRLKSLTRVEQERLLYGSWFARLEASGLFKREWCKEVAFPNYEARQRVRAWDFAFSLPSEAYPDPDFTRGVLMSKDKDKVYTVESVVTCRDRVHAVEKLLFETAERDGKGVIISIPIDPNAAAGAYARNLQRILSEKGYICRLSKPVKSKVTRFAPFSSIAQAGFVQVVIADWNKEFYEELEAFDGINLKRKDDQVDACSDCISILNKEVALPSMALSDFNTGVSPSQFSASPFSRREVIELPTLNFGLG